jgi:hypothetical protein
MDGQVSQTPCLPPGGHLLNRHRKNAPSVLSLPWVWVILLAIPAASLFLLSCSGSPSPELVRDLPAGALTPRQAAAQSGFEEILAVSGEGFLALDPEKKKRLLYLSGPHYDMGFQAGYLAAGDTARMVHDYCNEFLFEMLEIPLSSGDLGPLWEWVRAWLKDLTLASLHYVPEPLVREMEGIADGYARAREEGLPGTEREVEFADVLLLNQAMDVLSSLAYHVLGKSVLACNQFACWGEMTRDGRLLHGRDFQFYNAGVYQDTALLAVYMPRDPQGDLLGHPFVTVTAPGFVGLATGLNAVGISMAIDVVHAWPARAADPGLGGLLLIRWIMEHASTVEDAVGTVRETDRGCPWIYLIADGKVSEAVVLETIRSDPLEPWMEKRYAENLDTAKEILGGRPLEPYFPAEGINVRTAEYVMEEAFRGKALYPPEALSGYRNSEKFPENRTLLNYNFPDPLEERPDLIVATNHFLFPGMRPYQWAPWVSLVWKTYWPATEWRYRTQTDLLLDPVGQGNPLDWESAWRIADFLNPASPEGAFFHEPDPTQAVGGHVALMDGQGLIFRALFGYYDQPWAEVNFGAFLPER